MSRVTRSLLLFFWFWSSFGQGLPAMQLAICLVTAAEDVELANSPQSLSKQNCRDFASTFPLSVHHNFWLRTRLPDSIPLDHILVIDNSFEDMDVFFGSTLIYRYGFFQRSLSQVVSQRSHMISLNRLWAGAELFIRTHFAYSFMAQPKIPRIVSTLTYHQEQLVETWKIAVFVGLLVAVGLVAWAISISYLAFGVYAFFGFFAMAVAG